jgi:hypothetical protein
MAALLGLAVGMGPGQAVAGPPYRTDDPDPVAFHHWELYLASQWDHVGPHGAEGSLPEVEVNFGVLQGGMLHLLAPAALVASQSAGTVYGMGDLEMGANIRIVQEGPTWPQLGTFPIATLPTGSEARGLGAGTVGLLLPIWLMKRVGPWTLDGGGGVSLADGDRHAEFGSFVQRSCGDVVSLGAEVFVTAPFDSSPARTQLDLALIVDASGTHHLLLSAGPSFGAVGEGQAYLAWQVTP